MGVGYWIRVNLVGHERAGVVPGLPDHLFCDGTLDHTLDQIRDYLKDWIEAGGSNGTLEQKFGHLHISLIGPFPEEECVLDRRTPEQKLADADSPEERFYTLGKAAESRFNAGQFETARSFIMELQDMLPSHKDDWFIHNATEAVNIVLGRLALHEGNVEESKRHLFEAGRSEGSCTMSSFGPNMSLARDLLLAGEKQAVLDYFEACSKFWESGADQLDEWAMYVNAGRVPDFTGNLDY